MKRKLSKILGIGLSIAMVTSILIAAVPAVALTQPQVNVSPATISKDATYIVEFEVTKQLTANGTMQDSITITFPAGTTIGTPAGTVVIGPGWVDNGSGTAVWDSVPDTVNGAWTKDTAVVPTWIKYTIDNTTDTYIGASAEVRMTITGLTNPGTPGMYTLDVKTSQETTAVTSAEYEIKTPTINPLSGIVMGYNADGILMVQSHDIQDGIDQAGVGGKVEIGPGTYDDSMGQITTKFDKLTIVGTGEPGTVIIKTANPFLVNKDDVTVDGITFSPGGADQLVEVTGDRVTVTNSDLSAGTTYSPAVIELLWTTGANTTISNSTFDTTKTGAQTGIEIDNAVASKAKVTDCTFNVGALDEAIDVNNTKADISGATITGSSGIGVYVDVNSTVTVDDSSLMSLTNALYVTDTGTVTVKNSVVDGCGGATLGTGNAIEVVGGATVRMYNNTIQNSAEANWAINLGSGADSEVHFNNIVNNTKNVNAGSTANFSHNWWGSADGPAITSYDSTDVKITPVLGNSVTAAGMTVGGSTLIAKDTVGMDVAMLEGSARIIAVAKYSANPELAPPTIMGTGSVLGYYDLYVGGAGATDVVQVKFYVSVTPYTKIYYAGGISGRWSDAGGDVNLASGFAYITIGGTAGGLDVADLSGTVFAVVEDKTTTPPTLGKPDVGDYSVPIDPMFTWGTVPGAIRYEIALSEDPTFTIIEWSYNVDQTFYKVDESLRYDTTYYWRVRGVLGEPYQSAGPWVTPATPWAVGIFTTVPEPEPAPEPIVVQPTKPEVNVEIPPTKITIEPAEQAIPNYMLWIIIAVGAILVIALIVLIVRTRRVV